GVGPDSLERLIRRDERLRSTESELLRSVRGAQTSAVGRTPAVAELSALARQTNATLCVVKATLNGTVLMRIEPEGQVRQYMIPRASAGYWHDLLASPGAWVPLYAAMKSGQPFAHERWLRCMDVTVRETYDVLVKPCLSMLGLPPLGETSSANPERRRM